MAPKKGSAFMSFVMHWKAQQTEKCTIDRAVEQAGAIWKNMSEHERSKYKNKASKFHPMDAPKLTCTGQMISSVQNQAVEREARERNLKRHIEQIVKDSHTAGKLGSQRYYFIMCNYFTKLYNSNTYIPAEISVAEFSLEEGVNNKYHTYVNPEMDGFFGQQYEAQDYTNSTHKLPLPPKAMGESDLVYIYTSILRFIYDEDKKQYPPVFTREDQIPMVESVLDFLRADLDRDLKISVYPIQYLFYILKDTTAEVGETQRPESIYATNIIFERDFFEYQPDIACKYHEDIDKGNYCSQSHVTRWGYSFAEHMCYDLAITMRPGRHAPKQTKIAALNASSYAGTEDSDSVMSNSTITRTEVASGWGSAVTSGVPGDSSYFENFPDMLQVSGRSRVKNPKPVHIALRAMPEVGDNDPEESRRPMRPQQISRQPDEKSFTINQPSRQMSWAAQTESADAASVSSMDTRSIVSDRYVGGFGRGRRLQNDF